MLPDVGEGPRDHRGDPRQDRPPEQRRRQHATQSLRQIPERPEIRDARLGQRLRIPRFGPLQHVEGQGVVGDAAGHRPRVREVLGRAERISRHPPERRLQREDPAERRRHAHRPAAVGTERERHRAVGDRDGRPRTGTARRLRNIPGIARHAVQRRVRRGLPAEFRRRRLADHDGPGVQQALDRRRRLRRHRLGVEFRPALGLQSLGQEQILDADRHAMEDTPEAARARLGLQLRRARQRLAGKDGAVGIHLRVRFLDGIEGGLRQLHRRHRAPPHQLRHLDRRQRRVVTQFHCLPQPRSSAKPCGPTMPRTHGRPSSARPPTSRSHPRARHPAPPPRQNRRAHPRDAGASRSPGPRPARSVP